MTYTNKAAAAVEQPVFRLKRTLFGTFKIQFCETRNYMRDCNGSGYYDEWETKHWRNPTFREAAFADAFLAKLKEPPDAG